MLVARDGDTAAKIREWSSVIGIITAIIGNILISFALNIQRYAHIRLGQEQHAAAQGQSGGQHKLKQRSYGTQQQDKVAGDRVEANLNPASLNDEGGDVSERDGRTNARDEYMPSTSIHSRSSSHSTVEQSEKQPHEEHRKSYLKSPYWWAGIILMIIGEAGNFLAYGFAPASIVAPLGVVALVSNCVIAPCLLKERFRQRDFWGVMVAAAGAVVVVLSAKQSETKMGPGDVWHAITRWEFELYLGITAVLIIALLAASGKYGERTILIDIGLVGLFGKSFHAEREGLAQTWIRWLHCLVHQRRRFSPFLHALACFDLPHHLPPRLYPCRFCPPPDPIRQSCVTTLRLHSSDTDPVCTLYYLSNHR